MFDVYLETVRNCEYCSGVAVDECFSGWGCNCLNKAVSVIFCKLQRAQAEGYDLNCVMRGMPFAEPLSSKGRNCLRSNEKNSEAKI